MSARVGVLAGGRPPATLPQALQALVAVGVDPVGSPNDRADYWIWAGENALPPLGDPFAVWLRAGETVPASIGTPSLIICDTLADAVAAGDRGIHAESEPSAPVRPVLPALRRRMRLAQGISSDLVLHATEARWTCVTGTGEREVPEHQRASFLAICDVAVVDQSALVDAFAWGTPVVTSAEVARTYGLDDDIVSIDGDPAELVSDLHRSATLAWAGHRHLRRHLGSTAVVTRILDELDAAGALGGPRAARYELARSPLPRGGRAYARLDMLAAGFPDTPHRTTEGADAR